MCWWRWSRPACEVIPTARAAQLTMNREGIRRLAAEELGLPTSAYAFADDFAELQRTPTPSAIPASSSR
jgi:phosphoribosylglycinamide formyltransferase 2